MIDIRIGPTEMVNLVEEDFCRELLDLTLVGRRRTGPVEILVTEPCLLQAHQHAASSLNEIGGLLLGRVTTWQGTLSVEVKTTLAAMQTHAGPTHVTFTADSWAAMLELQEREHPNLQIVGWYHSHPRMGIFLSDLDLAIHRDFFPQPWHIALVINGQDRMAGFFAWNGRDIQAQAGFYLNVAVATARQLDFKGTCPPFHYAERCASPTVSVDLNLQHPPTKTIWAILLLISFVSFLFYRLAFRIPPSGGK